MQAKRIFLAFNNDPIPRWKSASYKGKNNPQRLFQSIVVGYLGKKCEEDIYMRVNFCCPSPHRRCTISNARLMGSNLVTG